MKYPFPNNDKEFEDFCVAVLRKLWNTQQVDRYGRSGQAQHGVDILDFSGGSALRAAQCKHRKIGSSLSTDEIISEVAKAKTFPLAIHSYYILTTAERSTDLDLAVLESNRSLAREGLFSLTYMPWDSIERVVDEHPDLQARLVTAPVFAAQSIEKSNQLLISEVVTRLSSLASEMASSIDADLGEADRAVSFGDYSMARLLLTRIRTNSWDQCRPYQRFRLLTMLARALFHEDRQEDAGRALVQAGLEDPTNGRARSVAAQGEELQGHYEVAFAAATAALVNDPADSKAAAIVVRTAPVSMSIEALLSQLPEGSTDGEVSAALAVRFLDGGGFDLAISHAEAATQDLPDWPTGWFLLGDALFRREVNKMIDLKAVSRKRDLSALRRSVDALTRAVTLAESPGLRTTRVDALICRSKAYEMLEETGAAIEDMNAAFSLAPSRPDVLWIKAHRLAEDGHLSEAIGNLRQAVRAGADRIALHVLASFLYRTGSKEDKEEALKIWRDLSTDTSAQYQQEASLFALRTLLESGEFAEARRYVESINFGSDRSIKLALFAKLSVAEADTAAAEQLVSRCLELLGDDSALATVRIVADLLTELGKFAEALPLFARLVVPGVYSLEARNYIAVAERLGRFDIVLSVCRELRLAGTETDEVFQQEIGLMERYAPEEAVELLKARHDKDPSDKMVSLRLSIIGLRLGRPELVAKTLNDLPSASELDPVFSPFVVKVLMSVGKGTDAVDFSYRVLRRHFGNSRAHYAFLQSLHPPAAPSVDPSQDLVQIGSAILYEESGAKHWILIEDDESPDMARNEHAPSSPIAKRFLGRSRDDSVMLAEGAFQPRSAVITDIVPKYVFRYRDCLENWQVRFPDEPSVQRVVLSESDDSAGVDVLKQIARQRQEFTEKILTEYRSTPMSIHILAQGLSTDEISATVGLAENSELSLRTFGGNFADYEAFASNATKDMATAGQLVIDISAVATLILLDEEEALRRNGPAVTGQSVWDQIDRWATVDQRESLAVGIRDDQLEATRMSSDSKARVRAAREASRLSLVAGIAPKSTIGLAGLDPSLRNTLEGIFGTAGTEAMSLAAAPGSILWTDEYLLAAIGQQTLGIRTITTELVLRYWRAQGKMTSEAYNIACAKLIAWGYAAIPINDGVFLSAGRCAQWNTTRFPLAACLDVISTDTFDARTVIGLLLRVLPQMSRELLLPETEALVLKGIVDRIQVRTDRGPVVAQLLRSIDRAYGLNREGAQLAREVLVRAQSAP